MIRISCPFDKSVRLCALALAASAVCGVGANAKPTYSTFDPPSSIGTFPSGINHTGAVAGAYLVTGGVYHGFVRIP